MARYKLSNRPNWETFVFVVIKMILVGDNPYFSRSEIMSSKNISSLVSISKVCGHKKNPKHPEETVQRTLQDLRDKGCIDFLGRGEYKLTQKGYQEMEKTFQSVGKNLK